MKNADELFNWVVLKYPTSALTGILLGMSVYYPVVTPVMPLPADVKTNPDQFIKRVVEHYDTPDLNNFRHYYGYAKDSVEDWPILAIYWLLYWKAYARYKPQLVAPWTPFCEEWLNKLVQPAARLFTSSSTVGR